MKIYQVIEKEDGLSSLKLAAKKVSPGYALVKGREFNKFGEAHSVAMEILTNEIDMLRALRTKIWNTRAYQLTKKRIKK